MSVVAAVVLLVCGVAGLAASSNAARPVIDPTRWYSPLWLPAMVVTELAPLWLACHVVILALGLLLGGASHPVGFAGAIAMTISMVLLVWLRIRTLIGVRGVRRVVEGAVHPARGRARWRGRPVPRPPGVIEATRLRWHGEHTLDLISPLVGSNPRPVMVYVHGGGWTGGDPQRQARDLYHCLALDGWVVAAIRYPFTPAVTVEQQVDVVRAAVRWVRESLPDHGIEPSEVVVAGGSAGAHLASVAALTPTDDVERVDACVGLYGVYDLANRNRTRAHWHKIRNEVMLASVAEQPDRYRDLSPLDQIKPGAPPFLLVHGTHDTLVPPGESRQFAEAVRAGGGTVQVIEVYGAQHAYDAVSGITSRASAAAIRTWLRSIRRDAATRPTPAVTKGV